MTVEDRDLSLPPHSIQAETAVLGSVLKRSESLASVHGLRPEDFYHACHRPIFTAMRALEDDRTPIDFHTLASELERRGTYEQAGGLSYLADLISATATASHIEHYAAVVQRLAAMRRLISAAQTIAEMGYRADLEPDEAMARAWQLIQEVRRETGRHRTFAPETWTELLLDALQGRSATGLGGLSTGFASLDKMLLGLSPGDLVLLGARMGVGKTALVQQIAHAAERYGEVLFVSQEMSPVKIGERALAQDTGISRSWLRGGALTPETWAEVQASVGRMLNGRLHISYGVFTTTEIRAEAQHLAATRGKIALIVVDYLQLLGDTSGPGAKRYDDVGLAAKRLKELAVEMEVPILVPTQLNRDADGEIPTLGDIAESDIPARVADVVLGLHRRELHPPVDPSDRGMLDIHVLKSRDVSDAPTACRLEWKGEKYADVESRGWRAA